MLKITTDFTQFWFGIYSILVRNLLNSTSDFTQFWFGIYSIWGVKVLNSFCSSKCFRDAVLKTRVSAKALVFVSARRIKQRRMKLTMGRGSEIISEMASNEPGVNELVCVLWGSFSKRERALFLDEHKGEQGNDFCPRRWHGCSSQFHITRARSDTFATVSSSIPKEID